MARAGFWAISSGRISFRRDGRWYNDDEPINNRRIAALFSRSLQQTADGRWQLAMADERAFVEIEDTPWVVTGVDGDAARGWTLRLNDGTTELLEPTTLRVAPTNVLYASVKGGRHRVRLLRPAYYQLAAGMHEEHGRVVLESGGQRTTVAPLA